MRNYRGWVLVLALPFAASAAAATEDEDDWRLIGGVLILMQKVVHAAAQSPDPRAADAQVDRMLSGADHEANRAAAGMMAEVLQDVPGEYRGTLEAIARDALAIARRERAREARSLPPGR